MNWATANEEVFNDALAEGNIDSAQAAIDDRKQRGLDASHMETALKEFKLDEKYQ